MCVPFYTTGVATYYCSVSALMHWPRVPFTSPPLLLSGT